jgi:hypothetical protein
MDTFGQNTRPFAAGVDPSKKAVSTVAQPIKKPVMKAPATPAVPADPTAGAAAAPAIPASPFAKPLVPPGASLAPGGQPPSMTNVPVNPKATGQATQQEVAGMTLEQWRNVQRMLGMAPSV